MNLVIKSQRHVQNRNPRRVLLQCALSDNNLTCCRRRGVLKTLRSTALLVAFITVCSFGASFDYKTDKTDHKTCDKITYNDTHLT